MRKFGSLYVVGAFALSLALPSIFAKEPYENTIMPSEKIPDFLKSQRENIVKNGQFPLPQRDWKPVGLPPGLEKQVWEAWAPDAKPRWRNISPGYTNVIYDAKLDGEVATFILDGFGLVQSKDGGKTWKALSHHLTPPGAATGYYGFDISPADSKIIAAAGNTIDKSLDGGRSWAPVVDPDFIPFKPMIVVQGKKARTGAMAFGFVRFNADGSRVFCAPGAFGHDFRPRGGIEDEMASWLKRKLIFVGDGKVENFKKLDLGDYASIRFILPHFSNPNLVYAAFSDGSIYVCRDAKAGNPTFKKIEAPASLAGLQAIWMDVSPKDENTLLLTMSDASPKNEWNKSKIVLAKVEGDKLVCEDLKVNPDAENLSYACAKWNPRKTDEIFVGVKWGKQGVLVSEDGGKSFKWRLFPQELFPKDHITGYNCPRAVFFDRKSDLDLIYSVTGVWSSRDDFKHVEEMVMTHDYDKKLYGNKGVGFAECPVSIAIRKDNSYFASNDHGAWRSDGADTSKWRKISDNPGMPEIGRYRLTYPMDVSNDEGTILLVARLKDWGKTDHKLVISKDKGETWKDITERLGVGPVVKGGIHSVLFDPKDPKTVFVVADGNASKGNLFVTRDGCETFKDTGAKLSKHLPFAYDATRKILYASLDRSKISRSEDMGVTWAEIPATFSGVVHGLAALENGDLVVGDDGRLIVIPFDKIATLQKVEQPMIRLTIGDSVADAAQGLRTFRPILCRGNEIVAFTNNGWNFSNANRDLGPLLSTDGGKTFKWIVYDLSCCEAAHALDMRDGKLMVGNRGLHELDLNKVK